MKVENIYTVDVPLLDKNYNIKCYIYIEKGLITNTAMDEIDIKLFKKEFYNKYLLEYGDLKNDFIDKEYNKYVKKIEIFISEKVKEEKKRIEKLLSKLNENTIEFLKIADTLNKNK